ncbi:MAG TPA: hypothetical protein DCZ69_05985, partial [Syntrophobacteraceae bacterium]|nr:hypothetical protein [Syntrophobacteraceae bacterium]
MLGFAFSSLLMAPRSPFFPSTVLNHDAFLARVGFPADLIGALVAVVMGIALWLLALNLVEAESDRRTRLFLRYALFGAIAGLPLLVSAGSILTYRYSLHVLDDQRRVNEQSLIQFQKIIADKMANTDHMVQVLAGSPWIRGALYVPGDQTIHQANAVLDRYASAYPAAITYAMDPSGTTVASSNRATPESFVGKSYAFRPYFSLAMAGRQGRYFAKGVTTRERGYYSSSPVVDLDGSILGVAVAKMSFEIEPLLLPWQQPSFLIDPHGVVFLSNRPEMTARSLWQMPPESLREVLNSQQFGDGPFAPLLSAEPQDGERCELNGHHYLVARQPLAMEGWSVVLLGSLRPVAISRIYGIALTILMCSGLIGLVMLWNVTLESTARVLASERLLRSVVDAAPYWISLLARDGSMLTINRSGLDTMGWNETDAIGK